MEDGIPGCVALLVSPHNLSGDLKLALFLTGDGGKHQYGLVLFMSLSIHCMCARCLAILTISLKFLSWPLCYVAVFLFLFLLISHLPTPSSSCLLTVGTFCYSLFGSQLVLLDLPFLESLYPQLPYPS